MPSPSLLLIVDDQQHREAATARAQGALEHWPEQVCPQIRVLDCDEACHDASGFENSVTWVMIRKPDAPGSYQVLDLIAQKQLPAIYTCLDANIQQPLGNLVDEGIVVCPIDAQPQLACVMLQTLFSQLPVMTAMRHEIRLLQVHQGGMAQQITKMDEELRMAAQLQREFLPAELPAVDDVSFAALWRPAGYVSGDIYDVIRLDEQHVGFFVADAVGHGVPAALMTMFLKRSMQTKRLDPDHPRGYHIIQPGDVLAKLNTDMIERQSGKIRFATACYGVISCDTRKLTIARAGHPFPILLRHDGRTELVDPEGGLLGVFPQEVFHQAQVILEPGDRLLIYSDGFELAFPDVSLKPGRSPGSPGRVANEQYTQEFEDLRSGPLEEALERLDGRLNTQAGSLNQRDDLTVLGLVVAQHAQQSCACDSDMPADAA